MDNLGSVEAMGTQDHAANKWQAGARIQTPHLLSAGTMWIVEETGVFQWELQKVEAFRADGKVDVKA